ncbi:MAG: hypothetical protein M3Q44_07505 [bacterium]|nr:hypothetical protein [bacterium]
MKKLTHSALSFILVFALTFAPLNTASIGYVFAEEAAPVAIPQAPATPQPPSSTPTPPPSPTQPSSPEPSFHPNPNVATPKPAVTAKPAATSQPKESDAPKATVQAAATPVSAATPVPSVIDATPLPDVIATNSTGGQHGNRETGDSTVTTGDANVNGSLVNSVNSNLSGGGAGGNGGTEAGNTGNGDSSNNNANANNATSSDQAMQNSAALSNNVEMGAVSGQNTASRNTGDGTVITGDANVGVTVINGANNNVSGLAVNQYDVNGNQTGDIVLGSSASTASCGGASSACSNGVLGSKAGNTGNGTESSNNASSNNNQSSTSTMSNDADVVNDVAIDAVTGRNSADSNVGSGNVDTGDANVAVTLLNFLNNNIVAGTVDVINIFGEYVGNIILPESQPAAVNGNNAAGNNAAGNNVSANRGNGDSSQNNASPSANSSNNTTQANLADIANNLDVNANTGNNAVKSNTNGENNVETGNTNVDANVYNVSNVNSTDGGYIVLVNDNGTWKGTIYGGNGKQSASEGVNFTVAPDGSVVASNNGNGTESENNAQASSNASKDTTQTNNAKVANNVKINADTGNNSASRNVGGGDVKTGNVNVAASIMNFVNNNFAGKTFRVVMVNVLGKWTGSVVPAGHKAPAAQGGSNNNAVAGVSSATTPAPTVQPSASLATTPKEVADGTVLGKMTINKAGKVLGASTKQAATIDLKDGHKYLVDDTLNVPNDKPIVAAAVGMNTKSVSGFEWQWLLAGFMILPFAGIYAIKRVKNKAIAPLNE